MRQRMLLQAFRDVLTTGPSRSISSSAVAWRYQSILQPPLRPEGVPSEAPKPKLVDQYLGLECMSRAERRKEHLQDVIRQYERFPGDTGSSEVQVALLTEKIYALAEHMKVHRKDYSSRRGLEGMLSQRRKLLQYLRRTKFDNYAILLTRLGLKDSYNKLDRYTARKLGREK